MHTGHAFLHLSKFTVQTHLTSHRKGERLRLLALFCAQNLVGHQAQYLTRWITDDPQISVPHLDTDTQAAPTRADHLDNSERCN
jgi:hypothetical protein